ncbi:uncharacterized protein LOC109544820 isoform X1 [Dendroctonus ponderosae]|uniref:uncharacterized protein LOC109544820 isoform X1 n=2 Tax=Dendroctonus ponderosae TaxID=77166 RepID=UPI00203515D7|nr:uncharacterized protein LOC109544820 isoform X1 [Dendroctonus ponderosae]
MNMSDAATQDDTWEDFFGSSPDLMPSIMGAFDAYLHQKSSEHASLDPHRTSTPKRSHQLGGFAHLSPCVQKILSNVPEQEISKKFSSEEALGPRRSRFAYRSLRGAERNSTMNRSTENLDIISPGVHKMLSNLQDSELVISTSNLHVTTSTTTRTMTKNQSYLFSRGTSERNRHCRYASTNGDQSSGSVDGDDGRPTNQDGSAGAGESGSDRVNGLASDNSERVGNSDGYSAIPLGSYLHSDKGIASRTPVGRKNLGKYLQVPSESSTGMTNSTVSSSEVSRPVSLTSLGSCSSSGSSNGPLHQPGSAYLASAESLDSDPEPAGSQGSADSGIAEQEPQSINPEQRVLQEVLDTETVYVAALQEVIQGYLEPWRNDPDCPLGQHLQDLFTNLEEIHEFNRQILEDLRKANLDPTKTANVFLQHDGGFKVYNDFCARYPRTMEVLSALQRDDEISPLIREKQLQLGHALPLGSYLLKPVQRILKYHLLLQRLSKQCEPQHKPTVDLALTTMTAVAADINNMKRKHEDAVRVQEIQSQLYGWTGADLTTLGELIAEGTFRVQGAKGRRHVFLFEKVLLLAKSKTEGALAYKTHIECSNLMLVEQVRGEPLSFQILPFDNPRLQCTLRARSPQHKREWTLQIKRVILENYSAVIPNHARQLVMQLGQDVQDNEDTSDRWSPLKHNSITPHYLERRTRVRKTRELSKERSVSQDRVFTSFGSWRRKSEPSMIPQQYDAKVIPKKISKLKKSKETGSSTFYTDLSDLENCDLAAESVESLSSKVREDSKEEPDGHVEEISPKTIESNLEKIVSELLMQNQDFHKVFNRSLHQNPRHPRRNVTSEPGPIWYDERPELPSKADSLPRSFQLNDPELAQEPDEKSEEFREPQHNDMSSRLDETDHPEYKIYRKTPIRLSILQRLRMVLSEDQRRNKYPFLKQSACKTTGEKLANPDYVDPQTLFASSRNNSQASLSLDSGVASGCFEPPEDFMGERVELDMSLNEKEVLREIDQRLSEPSRTSPSDSYYESILDSSLKEEYVQDKATGKMVAKSDSFTNNDRMCFTLASSAPHSQSKQVLKRPTKAPPPIPAKPLRLTRSGPGKHPANGENSQTSWVKAMVGRFE